MRKLRTIEMNRLSIEEFKEANKLPLVVVLDDVRSLYNVGSVFRSGDAFRITAVYLCGITATPPNTEIHKRHSAVRTLSIGNTSNTQKMLSKHSTVKAITCIVWSKWRVLQNFKTYNLHSIPLNITPLLWAMR